jgi:hypothetical protein
MEVNFSSYRGRGSAGAITAMYVADVDPRLTASQALQHLHSPETGPYIEKLPWGYKESLILNRTGEELASETTMGQAGVREGDVIDVVFQPAFQSSPKAGRSWVGLLKVKRKPGADSDIESAFKEDVKSCIEEYTKESSIYKNVHYTIQFVIISGAAIVTTLIAIPATPHWAPAIISGVVSIAAATTSFYKFSERSLDLYVTAEAMQLEINRYITKRGQYKLLNQKDAFDLFMDQIETISREHTQKAFNIDKISDEEKRQSNK